jgi:hypothetical protein
MKNKITIIAIILFSSLSGFGQDRSGEVYIQGNDVQSIERFIKLKEHTKEETIKVEISENTYSFELNVQTTIYSGKLTVEIYNPNQEKEGTFSVGTQLNMPDSEMAKGQINKKFIEPQPGEWTIKMIPAKASGEVMILSQTSH